MLVFSTKLPLKDCVTKEICLDLFIEWITKSDHYPINEIPYDVHSWADYKVIFENGTFSIGHYKDGETEISACRLENREERVVWFNDCVFLNRDGQKELLIQLNCDRLDFNTQMPPANKPHIIRNFIDMEYCKNDLDLPVNDKPIRVCDSNIDICVKIMRGEYANLLPVVYVSCDYWGYAVNPNYLARKLSGVAHVFQEPNIETSFLLKQESRERNAHSGYVGIYFPGSKSYELFCIKDFLDKSDMTTKIIKTVWQALINRTDSSIFNWNHIMMLQSRQKMLQWKLKSDRDKENLTSYVNSFDSENLDLRKKIEELNHQNDLLRVQIEPLKNALRERDATKGIMKYGAEKDLYLNEQADFLYYVLKQLEDKYDENSRPYHIIKALTEANPPNGECERILNQLKVIFSGGGRIKSSDKAILKDLGFIIEEEGGGHYKVIFRDSRYMFTVSKTPSDHREGKNLTSDIKRVLDINKRII